LSSLVIGQVSDYHIMVNKDDDYKAWSAVFGDSGDYSHQCELGLSRVI